jgi:hypothetical protein
MGYEDETVKINLKASKETLFDPHVVVDELSEDYPEILKEVVKVGKGKMEKLMDDLPLKTKDRLYRTMKTGYKKASLNMKVKE